MLHIHAVGSGFADHALLLVDHADVVFTRTVVEEEHVCLLDVGGFADVFEVSVLGVAALFADLLHRNDGSNGLAREHF